MNIMELGAIGELIGGVAVIGSLIYVGLQIRQNTAATRAACHQAVTDSLNACNLAIINDGAVADIWLRGTKGRAELDPVESQRFDTLALSFFHVFETLFYQSAVGAGDRKFLIAEERSLKALFAMPGLHQWWLANPFAFSPGFRSYVESFIEDVAEGA